MFTNKTTPKINYINLIQIIISRWYWLLTAALIGVVACFIYLQFAAFSYCTTATLKFEEKKSEIAELISAKSFYDRTDKVESEKNILLSKKIILAAINELNYHVAYFKKNQFRDENIYPKQPLQIKFIKRSATAVPEHIFIYQPIDKNTFYLSVQSEGAVFKRHFKYDQYISWKGSTFSIKKPGKEITNSSVRFKLVDKNELIRKINNALKTENSQNTNTLTIKFSNSNATFCVDFLNALMVSYIDFDRKQRETSLNQTSKFITKMLIDINATATKSSLSIQNFNKQNEIYNLPAQQVQSLSKLDALKDKKNDLEIQRQLIIYNLKKIDFKGETNKLTFDLRGISDPQISQLVSKYQQLILYRNEKLNLYTPLSEVIVFQNSQIQSLAYAIRNSLLEYIKTNEQNAAIVSQLIDSIKNQLQNISEKETKSLSLQSGYEVDQKVYRYLSEKKLEALVAKAAVVPIAMVLDEASNPAELISPTPAKTYSLFITFGLAIGITCVLIINVYSPFIYGVQDIEMHTSVPIIGTVRKYYISLKEEKTYLALQKSPRSLFAESIRFLRGNLALHFEKKVKTICITSETSGEGKSFIALNLAYSFTLVQKRVVIVIADLRKISTSLPEMANYENGLSTYLSTKCGIDSICKTTSINNLDIIPSGPIPSNPSELIASHRMIDLINQLKNKYDYIIIDSAPVGLVTDINPIIKIADVSLFVLRSGVSKSQYARTAEKIKTDLQISSIAIVLNDFKPDKFRMNYYDHGKSYATYPNSYYYPEQIKQSSKA
ncbi:tyrosine-protein kinase Etk/Wzc [Pedobacter sp. UYP24]